MVGKRGTLEERFWPKVSKAGQDECWLWQATKNNMGYGMIQSLEYGRKILAHRASFILENGPIADNICVLHKCDTPLCVNPSHLFLGTKLDNVRDMIAKGRKVIAWNPENKPPIMRGAEHWRSKLTEEQAREIKYSKEPTKFLTEKYGVERSVIKRIRSGRSWKHL